MPTKFKTIDQYLKSCPKLAQSKLQQIRKLVKQIVPEAEEGISYNIPIFKHNKKMLLYFAGFTEHVSIYPIPPASDTATKQMEKYKAGKGTLRFTLDKPLPVAMINRVIKLHLARLKK
jgi:uncharacterized protein YdhG (YjbR/CyaY superfamily)